MKAPFDSDPYVEFHIRVGIGQNRRFVTAKVASTLGSTQVESVQYTITIPPVHSLLALLLAVWARQARPQSAVRQAADFILGIKHEPATPTN